MRTRHQQVRELAAFPALFNVTHQLGAEHRNHEDWQVRRIARAMEDTQSRERAAASLLSLRDVLAALPR